MCVASTHNRRTHVPHTHKRPHVHTHTYTDQTKGEVVAAPVREKLRSEGNFPHLSPKIALCFGASRPCTQIKICALVLSHSLSHTHKHTHSLTHSLTHCAGATLLKSGVECQSLDTPLGTFTSVKACANACRSRCCIACNLPCLWA